MLHHLTKLLFAPLLLVQVKSTRKRAVTLPEPAGERVGTAGHGETTLRLLIFGDSSAAGVGVSSQRDALSVMLAQELVKQAPYLRVQWQVLAQSGASSTAALSLLDGYSTRHDIAVVLLGVNDVVEQIPIAKAIAAREQLVRRLVQQCGAQHIVFVSLPPVHEFPLLPQPLRWLSGKDAQRLDEAVAHWATQFRHTQLAQQGVHVTHVPIKISLHKGNMAADGFHPGPQVYAVSAKQIASALIEAA